MIQDYRLRRGAYLLWIMIALMGATPIHAQHVVTDVGRFDFTDTSGSGARELSGLAYASGSSYYAVGDQDAQLHALSISIDPLTGQITTASINATPLTLTNTSGGALPGGDREGIAIQGTNILISNESGPAIESYHATTGMQTGTPITTTQPGFDAYANVRGNRAWESLTLFQTNTSTMLTANEDALTVDGPAANFVSGAMVRIQAASVDASNSTATAIGQFAYPIDAINGDNPFVSGETSGLVDLVTMPDNTVLAMERAVGATGYRIRLYQIDGESATDISGLSGLVGLTPGVDYTPLDKTLLWEQTFSALTNSNFEGIALGQYADSGASLVLVADNASGPVLPIFGQQWAAEDQSLYSLTIAPEPGSGCTGPEGCLAADLDHTGFVGINDLNIILSRWNQTVFPGSGPDPTVDGFVGIEDLNIVLGNWNAGTPPPLAALVPEPASALLGLACACVVVCRRQRVDA
jgi:phytase-like protein